MSCRYRIGSCASTRSCPLMDSEYPAKCFTVAAAGNRLPSPPSCSPVTKPAPIAALSTGSSAHVS